MRAPTYLELRQLMHAYDPVKAHEYYERTKKLKGRRQAQAENQAQQARARAKAAPGWKDPRTGKTMDQIHKEARAKARKRITEQINRLNGKLNLLERKIREMEAEEARENRKSKAKKERAAKEREKPKTAAEKAKDAREARKYRDKNKQKLKSKANRDSGGGSSSKTKSTSKKATVDDLKALATRVRGQIAVAKQKLAAL